MLLVHNVGLIKIKINYYRLKGEGIEIKSTINDNYMNKFYKLKIYNMLIIKQIFRIYYQHTFEQKIHKHKSVNSFSFLSNLSLQYSFNLNLYIQTLIYILS